MRLSNQVSFKAKVILVTLFMVLLIVAAVGIAIDRVILPVMESDVRNEAGRITQAILGRIRGIPGTDEAQLEQKLSVVFSLRSKLNYVELIDGTGTPFFSMGKAVNSSSDETLPKKLEKNQFAWQNTSDGLVLEILHYPESEAPSKNDPVVRVVVSGKYVEQLRTHLFRLLLAVALLILTIGFFLSRWFTRMITRPVERMLALIHLLAKGRFDDAIGEIHQKLPCRLMANDFSLTPIQNGTEFCPILGRAQGEHCITLDAPCNSCEVLKSMGRDELHRLLLTFHYMAGRIRDYQERLKQRYEFEARLLDGCPDGIIASDGEGRIILFNKGAERLLGYASSEVLNRFFVQKLYPAGGAQTVKKAILCPQHGGPGILLDYSTHILRKDGTPIPIRLSAVMPYREKGNMATVGFFQDLTELRQNMDALVKANERLNEANNQLDRLNRYYIQMLSFVTHELKAPIANSFMGASALRQQIFGSLSREQTLVAEEICASLRKSMEMIRLYLDLSRIEKDEMPVHIQRTRLRAVVIDPVIKSLAHTIREWNTIIEIEADEGLEWSLDPDLFRSVFTNLVENACKYGEKSGRIRIRAVDLGDRCRMEVWNSGAGISKENQEQLFKKFRRLDVCRNPSARGSGLGLFITKTIVERHGGRIWAESREGEWVNFIIELPEKAGGSSEERENAHPSSILRQSDLPN